MLRIVTLKGEEFAEELEMKRGFWSAGVFAGCLMAVSLSLSAQAQANGNNNPKSQGSQPGSGQSQTPAPLPGAGANPFPEDTSNVPVIPSKGKVDLPEGTNYGDSAGYTPKVPLPSEDADPVRSPDDGTPEANTSPQSYSSSSNPSLDKLIGSDDDDVDPGTGKKHRRMEAKPPEHVETTKEDLDVGEYYLERKNWKAALSRFESAMVLSPEEPGVYWGLAEAQRNLGHYAEAKADYLKLLDYDPDGPHGKAARKALKYPEIANAKATDPASASTVDAAK